MPKIAGHPRAKEKEKKCAYCERMFTKEEHLKRHERSHTGEKPFKCIKCNKSYGRSDVLVRHLQRHSLEDLGRASSVSKSTGNGARNGTGNAPELISRNDRTPLESAANRPEQQETPPQTQHQALHSSNVDRSFNMPAENHCDLTGSQPPLSRVLLSRNIEDSVDLDPLATAQQPPYGRHRPEIPAETFPRTTDFWNPEMHEVLGGEGQQEWCILQPLPPPDPENVLQPGSTSLDGGLAITISSSDSKNTTPELSSWQIMHDQGIMAQGPPQKGVEEGSAARGSDTMATRHPSFQLGQLMSPIENGERCELDPFLSDTDFSGYNYFSPGILDHLAFPTPGSPVLETPPVSETSTNKPESLFSVHQIQRMQKLWCGQRTAPAVRHVRILWHNVVQHRAANIFSRPPDADQHEAPRSRRQGVSRWGMDETCLKRLVEFCKELEGNTHPQDLTDVAPLTSTQTGSDAEAGISWSGFSKDGFPTIEVLEAGLDLLFQCPCLPFLHKATFDAETTPTSLLLPICLLSLQSLYSERSKSFVLRYQKEDIDECQAHMLCVQLLHVAEKHGLFVTPEGDDLALELQAGPSDREGSWKAWSRAESVKLMISCLLWMDMAYARLMGSAGVLNMDEVEIHSPCEVVLFEAPTSSRFLQAAQRGALLLMPRLRVHNFYLDPPSTLTHHSLETILVALYLQTTTIRHRLPVAHYRSLESRAPSTAEAFSRSSKANEVIKTLLLLPSRYARLFRQRHRVSAFAWHNVCIALTADLDLLEIAAGREGLESAQTALVAVNNWAKTPSARRATLHAAQIFDILSSSRLSESNIARPDLLLFNSALIISMYLFVSSREEADQDASTFELLQDIDWTIVAGEGICGPSQPGPASPEHTPQHLDSTSYAARDFIQNGGPVSFAGVGQCNNGVTAKKVLLSYVHLLEDVGKWRGSRYSRLLSTMSEFGMEGIQ
ncbi:hypothetical protein LTR10_023364 [Elasticomyces elasticus]|uniref:C2H2-type domain-containing protein n=1 Tax=Exophiala sideris TaxID=1016849 RepID=A0ABR0IV79_9EURO|nr:hypothetical protein LTR10_023364 [Elasticomyces elasticus]KAK5023153.1 hypothetical protein LTR13_011297 [Exophiala sideris]KAK5023375.1 hypothetical protein LTS07_009250 [Exophiala sideris]KAK5048737.1 hypothetical protein LTR69_011328 [Exophiala sideris]KAK5176139.1 hypothetical protein LTR44_011318 [Eurotiomycetes sp. CCFEE 6388]